MIGQMIAESLQISLRYAEKLAENVGPEKFGRLVFVDGQPIDSNHPTWVYGHLSLYSTRVISELGGDATPYLAPAAWTELFSHQSRCQDDPDGSIYPAKDDLVSTLLAGYRAAEQVLRATDDAAFEAPNPNEAMRNRFATIGGMHAFYTGGHMMIHMGQVSAWRRIMGLGSAM